MKKQLSPNRVRWEGKSKSPHKTSKLNPPKEKWQRSKNLLKEIARDSLALGSIPMFIIVAIRSTIGNHYNFLYQIILAGFILFILSFIIKSQNHLARAIILYIFTIIFYNNLRYTIFASLLIILILISLSYLKFSKKQILFGILTGLISSGVSWYIVEWGFK